MQLGFVSAILADLGLEEVLRFAGAEGFQCVELMCWPRGKAERRYAGVTHVDVVDFGRRQAQEVLDLAHAAGVTISGLGYYPNPLTPDRAEAQVYIEHLQRVIAAAELLGVAVVNTFAGRDPHKSVAENWPRFLEVWPPLVRAAEEHGVRIAIENCPMFFTADEWPGGKNLAHAPAVWRRMFADIPSRSFGLNYDPSHLAWQQIDYLRPLAEFGERIFHVHLKERPGRTRAAGRRGHPGDAPGVPHSQAARPRPDQLAAIPGRPASGRLRRPGLHRGRRSTV